jgi:heat shock protein HtpX
MAENTLSYPIETDIPANYLRNLMDFINQKYILPQTKWFLDVSQKIINGDPALTFTLLDIEGKPSLHIEIVCGKPVELRIQRLADTVTQEKIDKARQDIAILVNLFEEQVRKSTLFFAWREGEDIVPEQLRGNERKPINRLFLETQILLFMLFIVVSILLFQVIGWLTPIVLITIQFGFVFYSSRIIARAADWHITESNPSIHLLEYHLPLNEQDAIRKRFSKEALIKLKKEVYEKAIAEKGEISCDDVRQVFLKCGLSCGPDNLSAKKVDVYHLVKKATDKFGYPMPEVVVANTILPNAAASGPSPNRGVVLITTGLLVQLDEDEILSVLGHELGHLKGRDPLLLYGLSSVQYLFLFYVLWSFIYSSAILFLVYFWALLTIVYFIAKFFEARADLISAIVIGQPQLLSRALEKIGFKRLLYERAPSFRIQEWISLDPHPPIYFRINRLEKIQVPVKIKHPLIQSAKDVTRGFFASF